jgi:hypothetical protein
MISLGESGTAGIGGGVLAGFFFKIAWGGFGVGVGVVLLFPTVVVVAVLVVRAELAARGVTVRKC